MNDTRLTALGDEPGSDVCGCVRAADMVICPDCKEGTIRPADRCTVCGLSWQALEDAAAFLEERE